MPTPTTTHGQPAPAVRVGGRRMSMPNRPKPTLHPDPEPSPVRTPPDYPRPDGHDHDHEHDAHGENEQERPRRERRRGHGAHENDLRARENAARRAEANAPKHVPGAKLAFGAGGRIVQPAGKLLG
ncbi:hypothetical protein K488DRAFT_84570 [Vararia minispora EC-137]|uniref:Uncharacterized protein n=1 Tax=Vararia minispora EC-137 TaxID=1314806 RepID=A0ACB8QR35_9AGAM|nr:hypothetical protein K488DRAFT_84570 [Vararia minispora EC-137]